jgi:hypothetical protein
MLKYIFAGLFGLSVLFATSSAKAQAPICAEREQIIQSIKNRFQEVETEYGLDEVTGNYVGVFVQTNTRAFTFIMSPKDQSHTYCVLTTGTQWQQTPEFSRGVLADSSVITISIDSETGNWTLMYFNIHTGQLSQVTTGTDWERVVVLKDNSI